MHAERDRQEKHGQRGEDACGGVFEGPDTFAGRPIVVVSPAEVEGAARGLPCPICDGESVFESRNPASQAIRIEIARQVDTGTVSDDQIINFIAQRFGSKVLLDHVSFPIPEKCLLGVIGPSGAGKSTLLGALTGMRPATTGTVLYDNRDLYQNYNELRYRIGLVPQESVLHTQLTARRALQYSAELRFPADVKPAELDALDQGVPSLRPQRQHTEAVLQGDDVDLVVPLCHVLLLLAPVMPVPKSAPAKTPAASGTIVAPASA